jgi:RING-H2 zinc finger protein RHA1
MGFPCGYSEVVLPKQLLHLLLLLGYIRCFLLWAFDAVGLGDLLDLGDDHHAPQGGAATQQMLLLQHRRPEFRAVPAMVVEEVLPVVRFDELCPATEVSDEGDCAVCLCGIGGGDEVRRLTNCRHFFHRGCLDRWMEHDQRTCPLCRAPLIPDEMAGAASLWPAAGVPDASDFDFSYFGAPLTTVPSPTLLRPHELLLSGMGGYQ